MDYIHQAIYELHPNVKSIMKNENEGENEKLVPHPHDELALGLLILKLEPISSSL